MPYVTPADVRALFPSLDADSFPDPLLADYEAEFEDIAERYRGVAFTTRTSTQTFPIEPGAQLNDVTLEKPQVQSITSIQLDGADVTQYRLDAERGAVMGLLLYGVWPGSVLTVVYQHGLTTTPPAIARAAKLYVRNAAKADASGTSRNVLSQATADGGTTRYATPDWDAGRPTGWLDVDQLLNSVRDYRIGIA